MEAAFTAWRGLSPRPRRWGCASAVRFYGFVHAATFTLLLPASTNLALCSGESVRFRKAPIALAASPNRSTETTKIASPSPSCSGWPRISRTCLMRLFDPSGTRVMVPFALGPPIWTPMVSRPCRNMSEYRGIRDFRRNRAQSQKRPYNRLKIRSP